MDVECLTVLEEGAEEVVDDARVGDIVPGLFDDSTDFDGDNDMTALMTGSELSVVATSGSSLAKDPPLLTRVCRRGLAVSSVSCMASFGMAFFFAVLIVSIVLLADLG